MQFYYAIVFYNSNGFIWGFEPGEAPKYRHMSSMM